MPVNGNQLSDPVEEKTDNKNQHADEDVCIGNICLIAFNPLCSVRSDFGQPGVGPVNLLSIR